MEKQKRWQFVLILIVIGLTIYNILPTVNFYTKPLSKPVSEKRADVIAADAMNRVNDLEDQSLSWLKSFNKLLQVKAQSIEIDENNPQLVHLKFTTDEDANTFRKRLPLAGSLIPFVPSQLSLVGGQTSKQVTVQRKIPIQFDVASEGNKYFSYASKRDDQKPRD